MELVRTGLAGGANGELGYRREPGRPARRCQTGRARELQLSGPQLGLAEGTRPSEPTFSLPQIIPQHNCEEPRPFRRIRGSIMPGGFQFAGFLALLAKLNLAEVWRKWVSDRHEREKDLAYRQRAESRKLELENLRLEVAVIRDAARVADGLGATRPQRTLLLERLLGAFGRIPDAVTRRCHPSVGPCGQAPGGVARRTHPRRGLPGGGLPSGTAPDALPAPAAGRVGTRNSRATDSPSLRRSATNRIPGSRTSPSAGTAR